MHARVGDCWIVIKGIVYDITSYVKKHPGGNVIMEGAGKDGTALYNKHHPWVNAAFVLKGMAVGKLDERAMARDGLTSNTLSF
jgi:cytochrome b involved in lipid metabolism